MDAQLARLGGHALINVFQFAAPLCVCLRVIKRACELFSTFSRKHKLKQMIFRAIGGKIVRMQTEVLYINEHVKIAERCTTGQI